MKRYFDNNNNNSNNNNKTPTNRKMSPNSSNMSLNKRAKLDAYDDFGSNNNNNNNIRPQSAFNKRNFNNNFNNNNNNSNNNRNSNNQFSYQQRNHSTSPGSCSSSGGVYTSTKGSLAYKDLSDAIWDYYTENAQTQECYRKKLELKDALDYIFRGIFKYIGIYIVGSSSNGFGTNDSDVDICLMISREEKTEAIHFLKLLSRALRRTEFIRNLYLISAKVPIIKFHDTVNNIDCDLNVNNHIGIRNTHLLKCYSELDWRATPLVLIIKKWAKYHDINDAAKQTISSYNLTLMAIYFMQAVCKPPVLPVLHRTYPEIFNIKKDITKLNLTNNPINWQSNNTQSLGELFVGFLDYYCKFPFEECVISIRLGDIIPREKLRAADLDGQYSQWKYLLIEEPFELINAARSVYNGATFEKIIHVFQRSASAIKQTKSLDSLFREKFFTDDYDFYPSTSYYNNNNNNNNNNRNYNNRNNSSYDRH